MIKKTFLLFSIFLLPTLPFAQQLSVEELWKQIEQNPTLQQRQLEIEIALEEVRLQKLNRLPSVTADASLQRNLIAATTPVPAIAFDPNAAPGDIIPLRFTTDWSSKMGGMAEWNLFDPLANKDKKKSVLELEKAEIKLKESSVDIKNQATQVYAAVVISQQQLAWFESDSAEYSQVLQVLEERYQAGRVGLESLNSAKQEMERKAFQVLEARSIVLENVLELSKYVKLSEQTQFSTPISALVPILKGQKDPDFAKDITALDLEINSVENRYLKRQLWPSISLNGYYGGQFYSQRLNLFDSQEWYGNSYVSLGVKLPLTAFLTQKSLVNQNLRQRELFQIKLQQEIENEDIDNIQWNLKNEVFENKWLSFERISELAEENKNIQYEAYLAGRILLSEYNVAFNDYLRAKQNVLTVQFDFINHLLQ